MEAILTILLLLLFIGIIVRLRWFRTIGLPVYALTLLFAVHASAAIGYGILHDWLYNGGDTFNMYRTGVDMAAVLWENPLAFGQALIGPIGNSIPQPLTQYPNALDYWEHYSSYSIVRMHAIFHLITFGGGYYAHAVVLSFVLFWGYCVLLKCFIHCRQGSPWVKALFLIGPPTVLLFGNGLHKESIVILALSLLFARLLQPTLTLSVRSIAGVMAPFILILFVKEFYLAALIIPWLVYGVSQYFPNWKPIWSISANGLIWLIVGLTSWFVLDQLIFHHIQVKQSLFLALNGHANVFQYPLTDSADVPKVLLRGILNTIFLPTPAMWTNLPLGVYGIENYALLAIVMVTIILRPIGKNDQHRIIMLLSFFCVSILVIGIVVPNMGAIARYKAPALFALLVAMGLYWFPEKAQRQTNSL